MKRRGPGARGAERFGSNSGFINQKAVDAVEAMPSSMPSRAGPGPTGPVREEERAGPLQSWPAVRGHHRLSLEAAATVATSLDAARAQAAAEGRTLIYTIRYV